MMANTNQFVTVRAKIIAPLHIVWDYWTDPGHIVNWNAASDDWHTVRAANDLKNGGWFSARMEARDRSVGFDFEGRYDEVILNQKIAYTLADGRRVEVLFEATDNGTKVTEIFQPENKNSVEMQRDGWQAILDRFKYYVELNEK